VAVSLRSSKFEFMILHQLIVNLFDMFKNKGWSSWGKEINFCPFVLPGPSLVFCGRCGAGRHFNSDSNKAMKMKFRGSKVCPRILFKNVSFEIGKGY